MMHNPSQIKNKTLRDRGICVIIPTYNNASTILEVVKNTLLYCNDVFVVCDGCTDSTEQILKNVEGINLISYSKNRGKGYALKQGFTKALQAGFSYAITIDGDLQHNPQQIYDFLEANIKYPGCIIVGERNLEGVVRTKGSNFANEFSNFWFTVQTARKLNDTQTGYRLYPLKKLCCLNLLTYRYEAELELLVFAIWSGTNIHSIPIEAFYPKPEDRVSHFRPVADFTRISILNTVLCVLALIFGYPLMIIRKLIAILRTLYTYTVFAVSLILIITPLLWLYIKVGRVTDKKKSNLHKLMHKIAIFVMKIHGVPGVKFMDENPNKEVFDKPKIIVCNHQSHLDLLSMLVFSPKIVFLTNDWVWRNPFYGFIIRTADYLPISSGVDELLPKLKELVNKGYSIAVFPEGTRSHDCSIARFHKGAFYMAKELNLDILPMMLYGAGKVLPKKSFFLKKGIIKVCVKDVFSRQYLDSIGDIKEQTSYMRKYYIDEYANLCNKIEQNV